MASGLLSPLLSSVSKLLDLLRSQPSSSCAPRGGRSAVSVDVQRLQRLLRRIQAALDDAGEREVRDSAVKLWIEELTDLSGDAEDVLDDYRYDLLRRRVQERQGAADAASAPGKRKRDDDGGICESIRKITRRFEISTDRGALQLRPEDDDSGISERIGEITRRFEEISTDRAALHLGPEDGVRIAGRDFSESKATSYLLDESLVFGRTEEKQRIIKLVLFCSQGTVTHVLPVVGMGGIGKTTMAQMVYNDVEVQESFDLRGWVHVSQTFDLHKLTIAVTESLTRKPCELKELSNVHGVLKEEVDGKSVFLVLDDLWNERQSYWQDLLCPLKFARSVTILVTARSKEVASLVQTVDPFVLSSLPEDHCWLLFQHYAFGGRSIDEESSLIHVGRIIMQKCGGLPLAVKSIGCLLRSKLDMQTWMEISESEFWEYSDDNEEIFSALRLSFHQLPARLKPCFLMCTLYPKGEPFTKDDMIHLWIAHGYIHPTRCKTPEEVAGDYFDELNERALIEIDLDLCNGRQYLKSPRARSPTEISSDQLFNTVQNFDEPHIRSLVQTFRERKNNASSDQSLVSFQRFRLHDMIWDLAKSLSSYVLSVTAVDEGSLTVESKVKHLFLSLGRGIKDSPEIGLRARFVRSPRVGAPARPSRVQARRWLPLPSPNLGRARVLAGLHGAQSKRALNLLGSSGQSGQRIGSLLRMRLERIAPYLMVNKGGHLHQDVQNRLGQLHKLNYLRTLVLKYWLGNLDYGITIHKCTYLRALVLDSCIDNGCISAIQNMKHLRYLRVTNCDSMGGKDLEHLTESICHLYSLEKLIITTCRQKISMKFCNLVSLRYLHLSTEFNDWSLHPFCQLYNLDTLCLQNCSSIAELPLCIGNLVNLRRLQLVQLSEIKKLNHDSFRCQSNNNKCQITTAIFPALEELEFDGLCELQDWCGVQDSDCPNIQSITIRNCYKLRRIPYFDSAKKLILSKLALRDLQLSVCNAPSQLHTVDIRDCLDLNSLIGLRNLCSLGSLYIAHCPELVFHKEKLPYKPQHVFIDDCVGLLEWCFEQKLDYQVPEMVKIQDIKRAKECFQPSEHLSLNIFPVEGPELILSPNNCLPSELRLLNFGFKSSGRVPSFHGGLSTLGRLEIRGCPKLVALVGLEELNFLHGLVIADCPLLYVLPEMRFPPRLTSLIVQGCHRLLSLHYLTLPSTLIELEVSDCQGLMYIGCLSYLSNLESLVLLHCPQLQLQELLPNIPEFVVIFLCPKLKKWCEIQSIKYQESLPDSSCEVDA